ncbi:MAG: PAS domain S-box protein, partial [Deltaproteobacteria bacterium]
MTETFDQLRLQLEQARQALQASEARFRNIIERNADGIIIVDRQDIVHFVNAAGEGLLARQAEELLGKSFGFPLEAGETTELDIVGEDGQKTVVEMRVVESKWDEEPVYLVSLRDITERVRMEKALQESEKEYRQLLETLQEGVWAIDKDAYTTFVNPRMADMLGYSVAEMQGKHLFSFMDERGVEICQRNLERRQQGIKEQHEFELLRKDGSRIYTLMETSPMTDEAGNYVGAIAGVIDSTAQQRADEALLDTLEKARQREREVSALLEGSRAVLKYQDLEPAARAIFDACKDLIGATCGYVALLTEDGRENEVLFLDTGGVSCNVDPNLPMPIRGMREAVCRTGHAI